MEETTEPVQPDEPLAVLPVQASSRTTKQDFLALLAVEGRYYLPPRRNMTARFVQQFLAGQKKLLKAQEVLHVAKVWAFKSCTAARVWELFPEKRAAEPFLPDSQPLAKLDKSYLLNVSSTGAQYRRRGVRRQHVQG